MIANHSRPAIEGTIAVFSCSSSGYKRTGPSTVTCMGNGEWVPDPREVQCECNMYKYWSSPNAMLMYAFCI